MGPGPAGLQQLQELFTRIINISVTLAFFAVGAGLVYAAIKFLTSGGEAKSLQAAWMVVTWALLGVVFLVLAGLILKLVGAFTGVDVTKFCLSFQGCP